VARIRSDNRSRRPISGTHKFDFKSKFVAGGSGKCGIRTNGSDALGTGLREQQAPRRIERPSYWKISVTWAGAAQALRLFERSALGRRHHQTADTPTEQRMRRAYGLNESPSEPRRIALRHPASGTPVDVLGAITVFLSEKRVV